MAAPKPLISAINWHEYPFVRLLLPLILGIVIAESLYFNVWISGVFFALTAIATFFLSLSKTPSNKIWFGLSVAISLCALAYLRTYQHDERNRSDHFGQFQTEEPSAVIGWVSSMPEQRNWVQFRFEVLQNRSNQFSGSIQVYIEKDSLSQQLAYGDVLQIDANLLKTLPPKNPNAFNFARYLHYQNIHYQTFVRSNTWERLEEGQGNFLLRQMYSLRKKMLHILRTHLKDEDIFAVGAALTLGYRGAISEEVRNAYADTGAIHILAVSGLHVGIIAMILFWILSAFPSYTKGQKWLKAIIALAGIWLFALLTGASASVLRAATMFSFIVIGKYVQRNGNIYNSLAAAAFCSLLYDPYLLFTVGFQLSYLAVAGIVFFQPKIYRLWYINNKIGDYLWQITSVFIAAQLAVFPISLFYFHQFPLYFWLSSMIVIPAAFVILLLAIFLFVAQLLLPIMSEMGGEVLQWVLYGMNKAIFAIQQLPGGLVKGIWIEWYDVVLWYGLIMAISLSLIHRKAKFIIATLVVVVLLSSSYTIKKTQQYFNKSLVIYHSTRETIIDFFDGNTVYSLHTPNIDQKSLDFATQQYRWANGSKHEYQFSLNEMQTQIFDNWWMQLPYLQFYGEKIMLLDHNRLLPSEPKLQIDYLLIRSNPNVSIATILTAIEAKQIIFDASNSPKNIARWMEECEISGTNCYNVQKQGAFIVNVK